MLSSSGLQYKGIYRLCGVKSKVEKVCQVKKAAKLLFILAHS